MSKIVFWGVPAYGDTYPLLATLKELVNRGEQIIYYSTEEFREIVETTGAEFRAYQGKVDQIDFILAETDMLGLLRSMLRFGLDKLDHNLDDVRRENPDFVMHGCMSIWGKQLGRILGLKAVNLLHSAPMGRQDIKPDLEMMRSFVLPLMGHSISSRFKRSSTPSRLKERYGVTVQWLDMTVNREPLNIVYSYEFMSPELPQEDRSLFFCGPSLYFKDTKPDDPDDWWNRLDEDARPKIYISMGTIHSENIAFYQTCFEALDNGDYTVILSAGTGTDMNDLGVVPANFIVRPKVPQQHLLRKVDLFLTHSGMNSVNEAVYFGVPMLLFPHHVEQMASARRIKRLGMGDILKVNTVQAAELKDAVARLLRSPHYKQNVARNSREAQKIENISHIRAADRIQEYFRK